MMSYAIFSISLIAASCIFLFFQIWPYLDDCRAIAAFRKLPIDSLKIQILIRWLDKEQDGGRWLNEQGLPSFNKEAQEDLAMLENWMKTYIETDKSMK